MHSILGHIDPNPLKNATILVDGVDRIDVTDIKEHQCAPCIESTTKRAPISAPKKKTTIHLESTHTYITEKLSISSINGCQYFTVFLDDATARSAVYFLHQKSGLQTALASYKALMENELSYKMQRIRLYKAGENISTVIKEFINQNDMRLE